MGMSVKRTAWALAAAVAIGITGPGTAGAVDLKIGYIDSAKIFQDYSLAKEAQAGFDRQVQGWRSEAAEKQKVVDQLRAEVREQGPILSTLRRQEREEALQRAISEYEKFIQDVWGPQGRAAQENERATQEIVGQIRSAVEKIATDRQLDLVLDAASGIIVYADRTLDLTTAVLQELATRTIGSSTH